ncbi:hypothetical protein C0J52_12663 [Blattella germanica]|nr:hypothetical protein C0J52_12663 [Blattella germanica]
MGMPRTIIRTPENIEWVRNAVDNSPKRSTCRHASTLYMSNTSVCHILHKDLSYHAYKLQMSHKLSNHDYVS